MTEPQRDLIYDVGLFDGEDTAYYLFRGYRVVAIDANPLMVERARLRFAREIEAGRLTLLNVGISEAPDVATFWISDVSEWSSFDLAIASRNGVRATPVPVPVAPFSQLLSANGVPHYLKIDIEGNDRLCVSALRGAQMPKYISVEAECTGHATALDDDQATAMLCLLRDAGYRQFKLVNQYGWIPVRPNAFATLSVRLLNSAARGRLRVGGLSKIADKFTDSARIRTLGFDFSFGSSGPWGDDIPGDWMPFEKARSAYLRERKAYFSTGRPLHSFWYDWHATLG